MKNVVVIGTGNIGSRHAQSLASSQVVENLYLCDPDPKSLQRARQLISEPSVSISMCSNLAELPKYIDCAILAMSANSRVSTLSELLKVADVRYIILEKLLATSLDDLNELQSLCRSFTDRAFVNCTRRCAPTYKTLMPLLKTNSMNIRVFGSNWDLGSNAIHFLDLGHFLTGEMPSQLDILAFDVLPHERRKGYVTINGHLRASGEKSVIDLVSIPCKDPSGITVDIETHHGLLRYDEGHGQLLTYLAELPAGLPIPYQSELTSAIVDSLSANGTCDLTPLQASLELHNQFLRCILPPIQNLGLVLENGNLPIT